MNCVGVDRLRVVAGPAREEFRLGSGRLDRLDHLQTVHRHAQQLALVLHQTARRHRRGSAPSIWTATDVQEADGAHDQRQADVVQAHQHEVENHHDQVDRGGRELVAK